MNPVFAFLLALIPLVVFHELGHFIMAKLGGIKVTKFCIGFGKKLFGFTYRGTEYCWNMLPLGGYVDFMGELIYTGRIPDDVAHFYNRPKWIRFLVLVMGPLFNLILAFGLYWIYHSLEPYDTPQYVGEPYTVGELIEESPEARAGLQKGDRITAIDGVPVTSWDQVPSNILLNPGKEVTLDIQRGDQTKTLKYQVAADPVEGYGLRYFSPDALLEVRRVLADSPAERAGLEQGDIIRRVNDVPVTILSSDQQSVSGLIEANAPNLSQVEVERQGQLMRFEIAPMKDPQENRWIIGILMGTTSRDLSASEALPVAWDTFKKDSLMLFEAVKKLVIGALPLKMLSGPVGVARVAQEALDLGILQFIYIVALLSVNLGIMNLLPIPVLDGGEILVLLVEGITRKDFSLDTKLRIKMVGLVFIVGLMGFVIISDVIKWVSAAA